MSSSAIQVGRLAKAVKTLRIPHAYCEEISEVMVEACAVASATQGFEQDILYLFGPSSAGKTTAFEQGELACLEAGYGVVTAGMSRDATSRQLAIDLLDALGCPLSRRGSAPELLKRASQLVARKKVRLVVVDEVTHLFKSMSDAKLREVTQTIKTLSQWRTCGVMLVGTEDVRTLMRHDAQTINRSAAPIILKGFDTKSDADMTVLLGQLAGLSDQINEASAFDSAVNLLDKRIVQFAMENCRTVGHVGRMVLEMGRIAIRNRETLDASHCDAVFKAWAGPLYMRADAYAL